MRPELRAELPRRAEQDQAARGAAEADWDLVTSVDADNVAWLKNVVAELGWPGRSVVGWDGAGAAWLLAPGYLRPVRLGRDLGTGAHPDS